MNRKVRRFVVLDPWDVSAIHTNITLCCDGREKEQMRKQMNKRDVTKTQIFNVVHS